MRLKRKKTMFIHANQPLFTSFYIKEYLFFAEVAMSQRWSAIFCATVGIVGDLYPADHLRDRRELQKLMKTSKAMI